MARTPGRPVTMHDVAAHAGVSQATVSLVLNDVGGRRVTEATRIRVMSSVKALGYRTNAFAKTLRSGQSGFIGFISDEVAIAPFAGKLLKGAQEAAWRSGHVILTVDTLDQADVEAAAIDMMLSYRVRGIVYASMYHRVLDLPGALQGVPTVVVNAQDAAGRAASVFPDEELGGHEATRALLEKGHRRVAMINIQSSASDLPAGVGREAGYRRALAEAGVSFDPALVRYGAGVVEDGLTLTQDLMGLSKPPSAIFCGNDRTAWGAYRALERLGLRLPEDCSIVGFDNQDTLAPYLDPGLTTMELPHERMGRRAVQIILDGAEEGTREAMECSLVPRESVAKAKVHA